MNSNVLQYAINYYRAGYSILPIVCDCTKRPACEWAHFQKRLPTSDEIQSWYGNGQERAIGLVCGFNGLFAIDLDDADTASRYCSALEAAWPEVWQHVAGIETPRPGRQILCRLVDTPPGNMALAMRCAGNTTKALIETRGLGGYVVAVGSPASVHKTGRLYQHRRGPRITELQPIRRIDFDGMISLARAFNEVEVEESDYQTEKYQGEPRPGDVFNAQADWKALLEPKGWQLEKQQDGVSYLVRPGKEPGDGHGATLHEHGDDLLRVYTRSVPYGPRDGKQLRQMAKFDFFAAAYHGGSYGVAAVEAAQMYCERLEAAQAAYRQEQAPLQDGLIRMSDVTFKNIAWLWPDFIALGTFHIYSGEQKVSKSLLSMDLIARVTTGNAWPDNSTNNHGPGSVLLLSAEDHPETVIGPRLDAAGANLDHVFFQPTVVKRDNRSTIVSLRDDIDLLRRRVKQVEASGAPPVALAIIDPLSAYLTGDTKDMTDMRVITSLLQDLATTENVAILAIHHFGKAKDRAAIHSSMGSTSLTAACRVFFAGYIDPKDPHRRIFHLSKTNLAPVNKGLAMEYRIVSAGTFSQSIRVEWNPTPFPFDESEFRAQEDSRQRTRQELRGWLDGLSYPRATKDVCDEARELFGASEKIVRGEARAVKIRPKPAGFGKPWIYVRAESAGESDETPYTQYASDSSDSDETDRLDVDSQDPLTESSKRPDSSELEESDVYCVRGTSPDTVSESEFCLADHPDADTTDFDMEDE